MIKEAQEYHKILLERFGESSVKGLDHQAYHLQYYSSHGFGKSVKFENKEGVCFLTVKCKKKTGWNEECKEYKIKINEEEWNKFEKMIYEFNFWTADNFRNNKDVLDANAYFLEGKRPEAKKCNKKDYKLVGRGAPRYDRIQALCSSILEYESQIALWYNQRD